MVDAPEKIWIDQDDCPYFYEESELAEAGSPVTEYIRADLCHCPALEPSAARELALEALKAAYASMEGSCSANHRIALNTVDAAIRALSSPDHADAGKVEGDGWLPIESAPHNEKVLLSWKDCLGKWTFEVSEASWGWRTDTVSNVSAHGKATHWRPLPSAPASEGAE